MFKLLEYIGNATLKGLSSSNDFVQFAATLILNMFRPVSYHPAMRSVLVKQTYFTAIQVLPSFTLMAVFFGSFMVGMLFIVATKYGLLAEIGDILTIFIFNEFAPLFTAFLIALRSGAAVNAEIAVMRVNHELDSLKAYRINPITYLYLPRVISGMISTVTLAYLFAMIMLVSGYLISLFYLQMDLQTYIRALLSSLELSSLLMLVFKSLLFGFFLMIIPIYSGCRVAKSYNAIPISVLKGMVAIFTAIFVVEVLSLAIWFI